jgi:hypothetical protein
MNSKQLVALRIGGAIILALGMFPPWRIQSYYYTQSGPPVPCELRAGFSVLFLPPLRPRQAFEQWPHVGEAQIDLPLLLVEWGVAAIATGLVSSFLRNGVKEATRRLAGNPG